jgi:hypothetical protein
MPADDTAASIGVEPVVDQQAARERRRLAVLQAAATFAAGKALNTEVSSADVLKIAEAWERWIARP